MTGWGSSVAASSASRSGETFDGRAMAWSYESSGSQTDRALHQEAESLTHRYAESGLSSQQFAAALSAGIGASNKSDRGAVTEAIKGVLRGGGTLTGTYATNEQLQDQIADDIARRVAEAPLAAPEILDPADHGVLGLHERAVDVVVRDARSRGDEVRQRGQREPRLRHAPDLTAHPRGVRHGPVEEPVEARFTLAQGDAVAVAAPAVSVARLAWMAR